jgi:hypothetical protein
MPANGNPTAASTHQIFIIELERNNSSTARGCLPDNLGSFFVPLKMLIPILLPGIEERNTLPTFWVDMMSLRCFITVT